MAAFIECVCVFPSPSCACVINTSTIHLHRGGRDLRGGIAGGVQVVLGGSYVHNSGTFLEDLDDAFGRGGV